MKVSCSRRSFVAGMVGLAAVPYAATLLSPRSASAIPGELRGANFRAGHRLRAPNLFPASTKPVEAREVIIVGTGIAALSAAWWLRRSGIEDVLMLELEGVIGGNATSGKNHASAYPWGAHYLPLPNQESIYVRQVLAELGVSTTAATADIPEYNEDYLCHAPEDRLFIHGRWQEGGLCPQLGISPEEHQEYERFMARMEHFRGAVGRDGRFAFAIPLDLSSTDPAYRELDTLTFAAWLDAEKFASPPLRWYLNYCCRDDYGAGIDSVSAWAGIHYFAARRPLGHQPGAPDLLTWPAGNGWLVDGLKRIGAAEIRTTRLVRSISQAGAECQIEVENLALNVGERYRAKTVIFAGPRFSAHRIVEGLENRSAGLQYNPWLVANLTLRDLPESSFQKLAWDNVLYRGAGLGYVHANHQDLTQSSAGRVITYYRPLSKGDPALARKEAFEKSVADWKEEVISDLSPAHRDILDVVTNLDLWIWGHAMINPEPKFIWGETRRTLEKTLGRVHFAHADMSGISIFEEANYQGVMAAERALLTLGVKT